MTPFPNDPYCYPGTDVLINLAASVTRKRWIDLKLKSHPQALRIFQ
jgi:hypothetical protein